jgi:hypothetical protein
VAPSDRIYENPELDFSAPVAIQVKGNFYVTPITVTSAKVIATCEGQPVAAMKTLGSGRVYYIGTNLGASIAAGDDRGIELLRAIIWPVARPMVTGGRLRPRLVRGGDGPALLAVFNDTVEEQTSRIPLPQPYTRATDIHAQKAEPVNAGAMDLTVPHQDVRVLLLE